LDDRRIDGGTNLILRIKEHKTHLNLQEHDDDDDDDRISICYISQCLYNYFGEEIGHFLFFHLHYQC